MLDMTIPQKGFTTKELVMTALFTALTVVCAWISIPIGTIAITLQTFAVFCVLLTLGGKDGLFSCLAYILLGALGLPVFTGFKGGLGVLVGPTGGYILGFMLMALIYWAGTKLLGKKLAVQIILLLAGLAVCYTFGTLWFVYGYSDNGSTIAFIKAAKICVIPFVPFDLLKLVLALILSDRVKKYAKI